MRTLLGLGLKERLAYMVAPGEPAIMVGVGEDRRRTADHGNGKQRAEVAPVETVADGRVHEKDMVFGDHAAAMPDRQRTALAIMLKRVTKMSAINRDLSAGPAHLLPG